MIERIARAIAKQVAEREGKDAATAKSFEDAAWPDYANGAGAVLKDIRYPTQSMVDAGDAAMKLGFDVYTIFAHMIDAALAKPELE